MGVEVKAHPGIHLLLIFQESVEPDTVADFLSCAYEIPYPQLHGNPAPTTVWTLEQTLNKLQETFGDKAFVVAPHIDSTGGIYEGLKDYAQLRIAALRHPAVKALSFNKPETRKRLSNLFDQPDYRRRDAVAMIQSSDFHGEPGTSIGQPRTEVLVSDGKPTYKNIKEAFSEKGRVKCSIDFTQEEYRTLIQDSHVERFPSDHGRWCMNRPRLPR